jgi:hypothetical protein
MAHTPTGSPQQTSIPATAIESKLGNVLEAHHYCGGGGGRPWELCNRAKSEKDARLQVTTRKHHGRKPKPMMDDYES